MTQTVEQLAELLDSLKSETDRNAESFDKLLTNINTKLEIMSNDTESEDLIKVYLTELKKTLEERHALVVSEFNKIETSFKSLNDEQSGLVKTVEMKDMFDAFSANMQSIARELYEQKQLLAQYDERFADFSTDKTDKNDIITSVAEIKKDIEIINQGFEASIADINANTQSIFKNLIVMDPTAQNDIVRRELENVYLSVNSIISMLNVVDQKNDELAQNLENSVTNENFEQAQAKLNSIIEKYKEMSEKLENLAQKTDLDTIIYKETEISDRLNSLPDKADLDKITEDTVAGLQEKLNEISIKSEIDTIIDKTGELSGKFEFLAQKSDADNILNQSAQIADKLNLTADDISRLSNKSDEIGEYLNTLPQQSYLNDMYKSINEFSTILENLRSSLTTANENSALMIRENLDKLDSVLSAVVTEHDFDGFRHDLTNFIQKIIDNSSNLNDNLNINKDVLQNLITKIEALDIHKDIVTVTNALDGLRETSLNNVERITDKIDSVASRVDTLSTDIAEKLSKEDDSTKFEILNQSLDFLKETVISSQAANETSLAEKLLALRDMITTNVTSEDEKFQDLQEKIEEFTSHIKKISDDTEIKIGNSISEITDIKGEIERIANDFTEWNFSQENRDSKLVSMISSELSEIGLTITKLQDEIQAGVHTELSKTAETFETQINSLISSIESLKPGLSGQDAKQTAEYDFEKTFKELKDKITAVKQEINLVNTDIIDTLNSKAEAVIVELSPLKATLSAFSELGTTFDEKVEELTNTQTEAIHKAVKDIKKLIDEKLNNSPANPNSDITALTQAVKDTVADQMTQNSEDLKSLIAVAMNNDDITWAIDNLKDDLSDTVTRIFNNESANYYNEIINKTDTIVVGSNKISELLDALNQKIDILAMTDNSEDFGLQEEIEEIKNMISSRKNLLEKSEDSENLENIENQLKELVCKIEAIEPADIEGMRESILTAILSVFEQISFIEESEDIKDFVEEKTDEINQNIIEVKQQLEQITKNDDGYSYTLQDVESDIAKLRLVLNELSTSSSREDISELSDNIHRIVSSVEDMQTSLTQEQISDLKTDFEKLSEDVLSISSRTNKLLLTSDESYNALSSGLNDFSSLIYKLEERINYLDNKEITERIEQKLDNALNVVTASANSDKVMRQALMYMGEWIDSTSENIESLCEQSDKVNDVQYAVEQLKDKLPEQTDLLNTIAARFDEQQERMDRLEMKLERILSAIDDIDDTKLTKKVDKIDKQLTNLSDNIEKLASYVDE